MELLRETNIEFEAFSEVRVRDTPESKERLGSLMERTIVLDCVEVRSESLSEVMIWRNAVSLEQSDDHFKDEVFVEGIAGVSHGKRINHFGPGGMNFPFFSQRQTNTDEEEKVLELKGRVK